MGGRSVDSCPTTDDVARLSATIFGTVTTPQSADSQLGAKIGPESNDLLVFLTPTTVIKPVRPRTIISSPCQPLLLNPACGDISRAIHIYPAGWKLHSSGFLLPSCRLRFFLLRSGLLRGRQLRRTMLRRREIPRRQLRRVQPLRRQLGSKEPRRRQTLKGSPFEVASFEGYFFEVDSIEGSFFEAASFEVSVLRGCFLRSWFLRGCILRSCLLISLSLSLSVF